MSDIEEKLKQIENEINDIEAYNYQASTNRIIDMIKSVIKDVREETLREVDKVEVDYTDMTDDDMDSYDTAFESGADMMKNRIIEAIDKLKGAR